MTAGAGSAEYMPFLLIMLTTLLGAISILSSWEAIQDRCKEYYAWFLVLQTGISREDQDHWGVRSQNRAEQAIAKARGGFLTKAERTTLEALVDRILPPDDALARLTFDNDRAIVQRAIERLATDERDVLTIIRGGRGQGPALPQADLHGLGADRLVPEEPRPARRA